MKFNIIFKVFTFLAALFMLTIVAFAEENVNSLSQILVDKPFDNSYQLDLFFKDKFNGSAFLQKSKNGSFDVYIPNTILDSKNVKIIYKGNVKKSDVKISVEEQPYIKENKNSKYVRLIVDTPVNSNIQLTSQILNQETKEKDTSFMNIYSIIIAVLLAVIAGLAISIYRAMRKMNTNTHTTFPFEFLNSPDKYIDKYSEQASPQERVIDKNVISPISSNEFKCFDLSLKKEDVPVSISPAVNIENQISDNKKNIKTTNPLFKKKVTVNDEASTLDMPIAGDTNEIHTNEDDNSQDNNTINENIYRPELVSEFKIAENKGFYLTTVSDNAFALFGYIGDKVFFLQRFKDLSQINLQARFYANKNGKDLYVIRLDSYKAMLMVSDTEIKELAVI